ncbi:hypothetical protein JIN84_09085 [Luteolibacter yonseiensis]|uniref:Uncharacterized protein n=2 Tax=Luteolibacter yonseiensis TaxID=1144680 RepID=A0A934R5T1_9BACT|nr:hypothetical protein [Luteolibacter yonseiensis]
MLCAVLTSCTTMDRLTFSNYSMMHSTDDPGSPPNNFHAPPKLSDGLALNYANHVELIMRCNSTNSRISREASATAQIALAAFAGAGAAFSYSEKTIAVLGLGSAAVPQFQDIFNAKGRAEVYNQAADMIQTGVMEYYSHNGNPSEHEFTPNGLTLVKRVSAAISLVNAVLNKQLPNRKQMLEATEEMTPEGAAPQKAGETPVNQAVPASVGKTTVVERQVPVVINTVEGERLREEAKRRAELDALQASTIQAFIKWKDTKSDADGAAILGKLEADSKKFEPTKRGLLKFIRATSDKATLQTISDEFNFPAEP